ncbi:MAG TPA: glycosyltransferase [Acidobacteriaceae bacterium]|jgi:spore maturation protein CgeB
MKVVIFGLTVSSSWGNGHATLWRGLCSALSRRRHEVVFYEKDVPYYAANRDLSTLPNGGSLVLYSTFADVLDRVRRDLAEADLALTTSYCPDAVEAGALILESRAAVRAFYDLDTPVTLDRIGREIPVDYIPASGLRDFDLVLSFTGGRALAELERLLGAQRVAPLYGSVDPGTHFPVPPVDEYRADLSYLGTYAADRQPFLEELFIQPSREQVWRKFVIGGALYPQSFPWTPNIFFVRHMPPPLHPGFFCSSRATLNITRQAMAAHGFCPSGRLFEAAACGVPILSDVWDGLDTFFAPGEELLPVRCSADVIAALDRSDEELARIARNARERTLCEHTADERVKQLETICADVSAANFVM